MAKRTRRDVASRPEQVSSQVRRCPGFRFSKLQAALISQIVLFLQVIQTILDCSIEVATKCGIYATLVGTSVSQLCLLDLM